MSTGCVFEYLREAHLEQYHPYFIKRELLQCDHLASIQMHDYASLGVVSMADRVRLFKLVNHIKSLNSSGKLCPHGQGVSAQDTNFSIPQPVATIVQHNDQNVGPVQIQHKPPQHNLDRKLSGAPVKQTKRETRYLADSVEFRPGTDSPMFKCRKKLSFSDSECEDTGDDPMPVSRTADEKFSGTVDASSHTGQVADSIIAENTGPSLEDMATKESKESEAAQGYDILASNLPTSITINKAKSAETYLDRLEARATDSNHQLLDANFYSAKEERVNNRWDHIIFGMNADSYNAALAPSSYSSSTSGITTSSHSTGQGPGEAPIATSTSNAANGGKYSSHLVPSSVKDTKPQQQGKQLILRNARGSNASQTTPVSSRNSSQVGSKMVKQSKNGVAIDIIEKSALRSKRGAFNSNLKTSTNSHAYISKNINQSTNTNATKVKTLVHMTGYDYGVPNSPSQNKSKQCAPDNERIRVCIRKRPVNRKETQRQELDVIRIDNDNAVIVEENKVAIDLSNFIQEHVFKFDEVFHSECNNDEVYEHTAKPLVTHLFKGKRSTCFAFGQTGSGKTYTLLGNSRVAGLYEHAGRDIFERLAGQGTRSPYSLHVSYFEIYCGHLHDLLNKRQRVQVRENARKQVCIAGLMETKVSSPAHLKKIVEYGNHFRKIGTTGVNNSSSRSHAILQMELQSATGRRYGRLSFIDLAGSERAADSVNSNRRTQIEGAGINQSLLALKECIRSLDQDNGHTPYRQSKLTHILRDSFTGDSRTCMIANVSPTQTACENTLNTLRYANRVKDLYGNSYAASSSGRISKSPPKESTLVNQGGACALHTSEVTSARPVPFHPSNIQLSSTPKKNECEQGGDTEFQNLPSKSVIHDTDESPIRGHQMKNHKEDLSVTDASLSKSPKLSSEQKAEPCTYSPLKYTSKSRSNLSPNFATSSEHQELQSNQRDPSKGAHIYSQHSKPVDTPFGSANEDTIDAGDNFLSNRDVLSMKSLDKAAEYLMEVSNKVRNGYETAFATGNTDSEPKSYNSIEQRQADQHTAVSHLNTVLQRHDHLLSNFDELLNRASTAVGGSLKTADDHPANSRKTPDKFDSESHQQEWSKRDDPNSSIDRHSDGLKSRSEPSLLQMDNYALPSAYAEINHSGVYYDKDPPIVRPGRPQTQRSKSEEARSEHSHQMIVASENQSILSKDFADYEAKSSTRHIMSQHAGQSVQNYNIKDPAGISNDGINTVQAQSNKSALPSPADFLQSLAQMRQLNKHRDNEMNGGPNEYYRNRETLSRIGQNLVAAEHGGRHIYEMLGSPSNMRVSSVPINDARSEHSGITTVISRDTLDNNSNHLDGHVNCAEANNTAEQEGDSGLGASAGFKQISCDGEMSETDTMADVPSIHETRSSRSSHSDPSATRTKSQLSVERSNRVETHFSRMLKPDGQWASHPPYAGSQSHLLAAHEDQLSQITDLCKQEMNLLVKVRSGLLSFSTYVKCLQELLSSKADVLASLNSKLEMHTH